MGPSRGQAPLGHHLDGQLGGTREITGCSGRGFTDDQVLRRAATETDGQGIEQVAFGVEVPLIDRELLGDSEGAPGGQDRDLGHGVGMLREEGNECVPCLVDSHGPLLFGEQCIGPVASAQQHTIPGLVDVGGVDDVAIVADGDDGGLVDQVGEVRPRESGGGPGHGVEVDVGSQVLALDVHGQDAGALALIGQRISTTIEATWAEQAGSEQFGTAMVNATTTPVVGSPSISARKLIEGLLALVVGSEGEPSRGWPMASISSMKMIEGARLRASAKRSLTRDAPTPTNSSTKLEPVNARNGTPALAGHGSGHERLAEVPGGPTIRTPRGPTAPARA